MLFIFWRSCLDHALVRSDWQAAKLTPTIAVGFPARKAAQAPKPEPPESQEQTHSHFPTDPGPLLEPQLGGNPGNEGRPSLLGLV